MRCTFAYGTIDTGGPANLSPLAVHFGTCRSGLLSRRSTQRSVSAAFSRHLACCSCEQLLRCLRRRRAAPSSIHCPCARTLSALAVGRHGSLPALPPDSKPALVKPALGSRSVQRMLVPRLVKVGTAARRFATDRLKASEGANSLCS